MVSLRAVAAAVAISAVSGQGGGKGDMDMAKMMEMMKGGKGGKGGEPDMEEMMQMMGKGGGKGKGGKDGKGGKGGKDGGKGGPPPKEMTVKKARSMMKEIRGALNSASALAGFAGAEVEGKGRIEKTAPMAEKAAQSVLNKYEFEDGGLQHAVQSAMASGDGDGQSDKKIRAATEDIEEKITGKPAPSRVGRVPALDVLADKFRGLDAAARAAAIGEAEGTPGSEAYVDTMKGIVANGDTHVVDAVIDLVKKGEKAENKTEMQVRMNVLQEFMVAGDHKSIKARLQAEQPTGGKGEKADPKEEL